MSYEMTLTNNFWTAVHTLLFGTGNSVGPVYSAAEGFSNARSMYTVGNFTDITGVTHNQVAGCARDSAGSYYYAYGLQLFPFNATYGNYFQVGSGTTQPTVNDFQVESPISDCIISVTGQQSTYGYVTYHVVVTATADITISEICILKNLATSTLTANPYRVLIGRLVLPEEDRVTLASGENKTFDITIPLPKPTA